VKVTPKRHTRYEPDNPEKYLARQPARIQDAGCLYDEAVAQADGPTHEAVDEELAPHMGEDTTAGRFAFAMLGGGRFSRLW